MVTTPIIIKESNFALLLMGTDAKENARATKHISATNAFRIATLKLLVVSLL